MQPKEFINQAVKILIQIDSLNEELKHLKDEAKKSGLDVASLEVVLPLQRKKSEKTLEAIEIGRS